LGIAQVLPIWTSQGITFTDTLTETLITGSHLCANWMLPKKFKCWNPGEIKPLTWVEFSSSCTYPTLVKIRFRLRLGTERRFPTGPFSSLNPKPYILLENRKGLEPLSSSSYILLFDM
jgi:hypothetical protein